MSTQIAQQQSFDDPILALHGEATRRRRTGERIVDATLGALMTEAGNLAVLPSVVAALRDVSPVEWASYAPILGRADFLGAVTAEILTEPQVRRSAVTVASPGGSGALHLAIATATKPGDLVLTSALHWAPYRTLCEAQGRGLTTYAPFGVGGSLDLAELDRALQSLLARQGRALLILNDPCHNPTGYTLTDEDWDALVTVVRHRAADGEISIVLDHAYAGYAQGGGTRAIANLCRLREHARLFIAWSASKLFTMYGLRVGALIALCREEQEMGVVSKALSSVCRGTWSNCNHGGMAAVARLLTCPELRASVTAERAELVQMLASRSALFQTEAERWGIPMMRYRGGFFVTVPCDHPERASGRLKDKGLFVVPQAKSLRVALSAVARGDVPRLVRGLAEAL